MYIGSENSLSACCTLQVLFKIDNNRRRLPLTSDHYLPTLLYKGIKQAG